MALIYGDSILSDTIHNINDTIISYSSNFYDVTPALSNGYLIAGNILEGFSVRDSVGNLIDYNEKHYPLITGVGTDGTVSWSRIYEFDLGYNSSLKVSCNHRSANYLLDFFDTAANKSILLSLDNSGTVQWTRKFFLAFNFCSTTDDGGFLLCGNASSNPVIIKIDSLGNFVFSSQFSFGIPAEVKFVKEISGNKFVFGGELNQGYPFIGSIDSTGNIIWSFSGTTDSTYVRGLLVNKASGAINFCIERVPGWSTPYPNASLRNKPLYTLTFDTLGNLMSSVISIVTYETSGLYYYPAISSSANVKDLDLTNVGILLSVNVSHDDVHYGLFAGASLYQLDTIGNRCWNSNPVNYSLITVPATTNSFTITDSLLSVNSFNYLIKYDTIPPYSLMGCNGYVGLQEVDQQSNADFVIFPNPASESISIERNLISSTKLELLDCFGRKIFEKQLPPDTQQVRINISDFSPGLYFIKLTDKKNSVTQKVLIQR